MNLAEAIRKAATTGNQPVLPEPTEEQIAEPISRDFEPEPYLRIAGGEVRSIPDAGMGIDSERPGIPAAPSAHVLGGGVVRLEVFLPPEQISTLFRNVLTGQRTVLTLREAAGFLRLPAARVEQMAEARELPAFQLDGHWRFTRAALDEWMELRQQGEI
jgi:excisionase family DNA binding protein